MSDLPSADGGATSSGRGTRGGGGLNVPPPPPPVITNQQLLVLDRHVLTDLTGPALQAVKIVELEFARDVSRLAAEAYDRIIEALRASGAREDRGGYLP